MRFLYIKQLYASSPINQQMYEWRLLDKEKGLREQRISFLESPESL
jgi:hypothetical protein